MARPVSKPHCKECEFYSKSGVTYFMYECKRNRHYCTKIHKRMTQKDSRVSPAWCPKR